MFVYKHTKTIEHVKKIAHFLRKIQTLRENNSIKFGIKNKKFSGYCFDMNLNMY